MTVTRSWKGNEVVRAQNLNSSTQASLLDWHLPLNPNSRRPTRDCAIGEKLQLFTSASCSRAFIWSSWCDVKSLGLHWVVSSAGWQSIERIANRRRTTRRVPMDAYLLCSTGRAWNLKEVMKETVQVVDRCFLSLRGCRQGFARKIGVFISFFCCEWQLMDRHLDV